MVYAQLVLRAGQSLSVASPILNNAIVASYFMCFMIFEARCSACFLKKFLVSLERQNLDFYYCMTSVHL